MPSLWQASDSQQERHLAQFMDLIPILGGNVDGVDGDELVLTEEDDFEDYYEYEDVEEDEEDEEDGGDDDDDDEMPLPITNLTEADEGDGEA